jgi:poly(beta-D-mannuronate) lyase
LLKTDIHSAQKFRIRFQALVIVSFMAFSLLQAKSVKVKTIEEYSLEVKKLLPGDSIILSNGVWRDVQFVFKGRGEKGKYIYMTSETPGRVSIEGQSSLQLSGEWLYVSGLIFVNGNTPKKTVIEFRTSSKDYAYNSVLTNCVIDGFSQKSKETADHWVGIWGKNNSVEYCYFGGKSNSGTTLVIWPDDVNSIENGHLIYRNYFGFRPFLGENGGETIRIGTSEVCSNNSSSVVEGNYFERCNGEGEIISNKSGGNKFLNNSFFECEGSLTLRHGNNAVVAGNWFIGNGKKLTGGVRVINEGHRIYNNFFFKLAGDEFRSALSIMNAIPESPPSGYAAVKNVIVANNTFLDCSSPWSLCVGSGEKECTVTPQSTLLINNLVYCKSESDLIVSYDRTDGITLENNLMVNENGFYKAKGSVPGDVYTKKLGGFYVPYTANKAKGIPFMKYEIAGKTIDNVLIGAFQNLDAAPDFELATAVNCGPAWYKKTLSAKR